jgi:hypothetical protein
MIATKNKSSSVESLASSIVVASKALGSRTFVVGQAAKSILSRDYRRSLRGCLDRAQVAEIVAEAKSLVWPKLNREAVKLVSPQAFMQKWSKLGVSFQATKFDGPDGLDLLGFYARSVGADKRPLICVNTAHHPAAVGAAFVHEMGHHLTAQLFESKDDVAQMMASSAYEEHLDDPEELVADCLVSFGVLPVQFARSLFSEDGNALQKPAQTQIGSSRLVKVLDYFATNYRLKLTGMPADRGEHYLAAVLHYAKLRRALLLEYDI